jgi:hypothetical protein
MNWRELNAALRSRSERQVLAMLNHELATDRRMAILVRLHQRYSALRAARERVLILGKVRKL